MDDRGSDPDVSRRRFMQGAGAVGGTLAVSLLLPETGWSEGAPPQIVVGQLVPFTGAGGEYGTYYRDAARLAVDQINAAATAVLGGPIIARLVTVDSATEPAIATAAARTLVAVDGAAAMIAGWSSSVTIAVATEVTIPAGVLQIANGATSPLISTLPTDKDTDLLFRTSPSDLLQGVVAAQLASGEIIPAYKFANVATLYIDNAYGKGFSNAFAAAFEKRGGKVLAQVPHPPDVQLSYKAQLQAALKDKPALLLAISYPEHTVALLEESRDSFNFTSWQFTDANKSLDVLKALGGSTLSSKLGTAPQADPNAPAYKSFAAAYDSAFHHDRIPPFTETTYDAAAVIGLALAKVIAGGVTDASKITGHALAQQLRPIANPPGEPVIGGSEAEMARALTLLKAGKEIDYVGAGGPVDFDRNGDVKTPIGVWKFTEKSIDSVLVVPASKIASE